VPTVSWNNWRAARHKTRKNPAIAEKRLTGCAATDEF
jgi:hypothetical protein